jgi:copper chaperone
MNRPDLLVPERHWMILTFNIEEYMKQQELAIDGMSCGHCVKALTKELSAIKGMNVQEVSIGKAVIEYDAQLVSDEDILHAIDEAGFRLAMG